MADGDRESTWTSQADRAFRAVEHGGYMILGVLLAGAALLALVQAAVVLFRAGAVWGQGTEAVVSAVDSLLFVFMLIEILHTVRASLRQGGLTCEPFLVVGLIASIRRVLVITLQTSQIAKEQDWTPHTSAMVHASMIELGVMAALILAMVVSIYLLHRAKPGVDDAAGTSM